MMVCHCQRISHRDIDAAVDWMRAADPDTIITPGKVYRALGKRPDCGGCLPLFLDRMARNPNVGVSDAQSDNPPRPEVDLGHRQAQD